MMAAVPNTYWISKLHQQMLSSKTSSNSIYRKSSRRVKLKAAFFLNWLVQTLLAQSNTHRSKSEGKCYLILYTCSLTRSFHLKVLPDMSSEELLASLKGLIAGRVDQLRSFQTTGERS